MLRLLNSGLPGGPASGGTGALYSASPLAPGLRYQIRTTGCIGAVVTHDDARGRVQEVDSRYRGPVSVNEKGHATDCMSWWRGTAVGPVGLEPTTCGLKVRSSTN